MRTCLGVVATSSSARTRPPFPHCRTSSPFYTALSRRHNLSNNDKCYHSKNAICLPLVNSNTNNYENAFIVSITTLLASRKMATASSSSSRPPRVFSQEGRFLFDLSGFLILRQATEPELLKEMSSLVDAWKLDPGKVRHREGPKLKNAPKDSAYAGDSAAAQHSRGDLGGILQEKARRQILTRPQLVACYEALLGRGFRMDRQPFVILQSEKSESFSLHGGPVAGKDHRPVPELQYTCINGFLNNTLLAVSVALADAPEGAGGFCVVPGSHKMNFSMPEGFDDGRNEASFRECVRQPALKAGDVLLFSGATVHGALPWRAAHERRQALYRFSPAIFAYGRMYLGEAAEGDTAAKAEEGALGFRPEKTPQRPFGLDFESLTQAERAVLQPPYAVRTERPCVQIEGDEVKVTVEQRTLEKKQHDRDVFGTKWF
ncbi:unnamed protein product [Amoebophrya sp. A25]|nr:unnamed protein product [Amoebophrya sp. A25]|eukprot:GSA25T00003461001.1